MAKYTPKYGRTPATSRRRQKLTTKILLLLALLSAALAAVAGGVAAKYARRDSDQVIAKAKEFYFTSDYLTVNDSEYTLNEGRTSFSFELRNYDGLNISEMDIHYTVTVTSSGTDRVTPSPAKGTLSADAESKVMVELTGLIPGNTYNVEVKGANGYEQTLKTRLVVKRNSGFFKNTKAYQDYVILTLWTKDTAGTASFTVPDGLIPDATNADLTGKMAGNTISVTLGKYESRTYRFFIGAGYSGGEITVTYDGSTLPETAID